MDLDEEGENAAIPMVQTVRDKFAGYTRKEVEGARRARKLHRPGPATQVRQCSETRWVVRAKAPYSEIVKYNLLTFLMPMQSFVHLCHADRVNGCEVNLNGWSPLTSPSQHR